MCRDEFRNVQLTFCARRIFLQLINTFRSVMNKMTTWQNEALQHATFIANVALDALIWFRTFFREI